MANYNCTQLGCVLDPVGIYPDLQSCQSACVGWGCPPQLNINTNILFVYDGSGSFQNTESRLGMFKSATAWTETLAQNGWVGTADHTIAPNSPGFPEATDNSTDWFRKHYINTNGVVTEVHGNGAEDWLIHGILPYSHTNKDLVTGARNEALSNWQALNGSTQEIPFAVQQQYFSIYKWRPTLTSNDPLVNTGATYPAVDTLVVSFIHQSDNYDSSAPRFKDHYEAWSNMRAAAPNPDHLRAFLFPVKNECTLGNYYQSLQQTVTNGILSILKGNQDDIANGGTGTLDGTWIANTYGQVMPNGNTCMSQYCTTAPYGPGVQNPCVENIYASLGACALAANGPEVLCYWEDNNVNGGVPNIVFNWNSSDALTNPFWVAGSPTWGALIDKGWGINVTLLGTDSTVLADALNSQVGTIATPATVCISAETNYTTNLDYPYQTLLECNNVCFPNLEPWYCDGQGTPCYQDSQGTFGWATSTPPGPYADNNDAYTACTATCNTTTGWTCGNYGCIQATGDTQFDSLSACTAQCQSYSCTTQGCYGPFQGTGTTGTYHNAENPTWGLTACTAACYHFECVTSSYAASGILPNDYNSASSGTTNGCLQLPGSGGTSPNALGFNEYTTLTACTASCISWQCCNDETITPNSVMYVYYDITSMNNAQTENAIKGIIDWTENTLDFTGHTYHMLWWSERWLVYPTIAYDMKAWRFSDTNPSSYLFDQNNFGAGIVYLNGAKFGNVWTNYGHSAGYWTGSNSPAYVLDTVYDPTFGFDFWTSAGQYNGNATHSVHDSFQPGYNTSQKVASTNAITKGYGGIQTASTSDDVITVIFQDESYSMYHGQNANWDLDVANTPGNLVDQPTSFYTGDHAHFFTHHNSVTATTQGGGTGGSLRSFLYPTLGQTQVGPGFALHAVAAISSGDLSPVNGLWSSTTYPMPNNPPHAQCEFNLSYLSISSTATTGTNPYWTDNGDGTFAPTYGGLDQYNWFINFRFDTYDASVFQGDITAFLTATTISCATICNSGYTAVDAEYPYSSQTLCEGLVSLAECTGCTRFNCGDNGCYTATTGQYSCLADCTASCYSYSCTTTGCTDHNPPTGTTFPYTATDGVSYYSYYGSGGTFSSNTDCELVCNEWQCGEDGCYLQLGGTGQTGGFSSQTACQLACSGYNCDNQFGCIPEIGNDYEYSSLLACQTGCTHWECNALIGCIEVTGQTTGSIYEFQTQTACTQYCASFNCGANGCYELSNLSGTYQDITQLPIISSAACTASCVSYNCGVSGCSEVTGTGGTFSTSASCTATCVSYSCGTINNPGCNLWNVPNYGTGGTWTGVTDCDTNCKSWECGYETAGDAYNGHPTGCIPQPYTGGSFSSLTHCLEEAYDYLSPDYTNTGSCTTWDCSANGCIAVSGTNGQFNSLASCTGQCTSYSCSTGTMSEGSRVPGSGGCDIYNAPLYGTGGTFFYLWECSGGCRSWDCTSTGCTEVSADVGSGGTYLTAIACDSGCTSYNCGDTGCTSQVGSGGTYFNSTNPDWGATACTATCISYNCEGYGCLPAQLGSGGTFYNATSTNALTACTAACISYECTTGGCASIQGTGETGTFSAESACTGTCISWGCLNNPTYTSSKIYAYYDTTSMSVSAIQDAIEGLENWILGIQNFTGSLYHTCVNDERWLSWASSVYQSAFTAGTANPMDSVTSYAVHNWASGLSMTNVYDNMAPGQAAPIGFAGILSTGPAPAADHDDNVLVITFIDESAGPNDSPLFSFPPNNVYTSRDAGGNNDIPNFAGLTANPLDQPTPTWKVDYTAYSATYLTVTTASGTLDCFMYPTESFSTQSPDNELFALHIVAAIDSGNQAVGAQGQNWQPGTAPRRLISGGIQGGTPELCGVADLTALEVSNPYLLTVDSYTPNVGKLDTQGWGYNINFQPYTTIGFQNDLSAFLNTISMNLSLCVSANTIPTSQYPHLTYSACTGDCYSYQCTSTGCVPFNGTGGTPTFYSTLDACQSACTSWNCTTTACTEQTGTGGTWTSSGGCLTACTSFNCEDITVYTPSQSWPLANGCIQQTGSGGTFYGAAAGSSGSSIFGWTACTADCQSWTCTINCTGGTTGCTSWPNTAATYTALTSCTASCSIDWYCTTEYIADTCDGLIDTTYVDMAFYGSGIPYFSDDPGNHLLTFSVYKFTKIVDPSLQYNFTNMCDSPWNASHYQGPLPSSLDPLQPYLPSTLGYYAYINYIEIFDQAGGSVAGPYNNWNDTINGILAINDQCLQSQGLSTTSTWAEIHMAFNNCSYNLSVDYDWCTCYPVPCDVFCNDGYVSIPANAQGPFTTSGAAESACCVNVTYSCVTATTLDSCSGRTTLPGQFNSTSDAWDWLTVNLPNTNLTTLSYESTTPAINVSGACEGPNGGILYEIAPVSYSLLNANVSYNTWNLFINQMQAAGTTGILSGMSYSNVNNYVYAQSGQTILVCDEICHCSFTPCRCIEVFDGTGQYSTHEDCISGTTNLAACCPDTGTTTGTSWECTSGTTMLPICDTKPFIGHFNDQFAAVDYFRVGNPTGIFGQQRYTQLYNIDSAGNSVLVTLGVDVFTWSQVSANMNPAYQWQSCYEKRTLNIVVSIPYWLPYKYIKSISHPGVTGGLEYTNWDAFYTAAAAAFTLTPTQTALQVCQSIDNQYFLGNTFGCVVDMGKCCNEEDCFCYELYTTGGTYSTEAQCEHPLTGCCPEYTGWTCEHIDPITNAVTVQLPCYFISQGSPIPGLVFTDNAGNGFDGETECNTYEQCSGTGVGDYWSCTTTEVNTCDPDGSSLGEITGTTLGPNMVQTDFTYSGIPGYQLHPSTLCSNPAFPNAGTCHTQYPFSSSTDQFWPLLQPTAASVGYLGGYGQVETVLTDYHYYDPYTPLSSTTFQLGSVDILGTSLINPNDPSCVYPLPYTLPVETCMGINATGGTGMPLFSILSVAHTDINSNTPYGSWGEFIDAASALGYSVTTAHTVADFGTMYPLRFGCSESIITTQTPPTAGAPWYSGCNWTFEMVPCLCDTVCCCVTGFTTGYTTEAECLDPISGCCPELTSYTCTINGCIDPGNGSGEFSGLTALADCEAVCKEWYCLSSTTIDDSCIDKSIIPTGGGLLPDIVEFTPNYPSFNRGPWDALAYFADPANGLQGQAFINFKFDCGQGCGLTPTDCDSPLGAYKYLSDVHLLDAGSALSGSLDLITGGTGGAFYFSQLSIQGINNWVGIIDWLNNNITINGQSAGNWTYNMDYNEVADILWNGVPGTQFDGGWELIPMVGSCICTPGPCDCVLTGGTGHSNTYHLITGQTQCELDCCSGSSIPECGILITGQEEGVLYYDFDTNATTKLFDTPAYERLDIAARQNKLWIYAETGAVYDIQEYDVVYNPTFQHVFNRNIYVPSGNMGRGLTPTQDPNVLITANDKVWTLDITTNAAVSTLQFPLPSGLTCTGDIMYDHITGNMIITYGSGTTQYVGKFDATGNLLEESHINTTTAGIGTGETIDSLFNYGTWTNDPASGQQMWNGNLGPIYGITTERRVIELLQTPILQFAPIETQTLPLVNQITNKVHGATNIVSIVNGVIKTCVDITGDTASDVYWCDEMLGCLPYPPNVTPPNSTGPHVDLITCQDHCNFVCGDCVQSCECTLVTTPIGGGCNAQPTMNDCIQQNLANTNIIHGGEGCCDCYACQSVTFDYYQPTLGTWSQQTVNTNLNIWGNFVMAWSPGTIYSVGDVVLFTDVLGNKCCYTLVYHHYDEFQTPYDAWTQYSSNVANGIPVWPGSNNGMSWIVCDESCPTIVTWSCVTGTTVVTNDTCRPAVDTGVQGLSFTPQIQYIAYGGYTLWHTPFENLKWDSGSQQNPLPTNPCPAMIGHWAKIIGCRITHVNGVQATPLQAAIQTTWADFIDQINNLLGGGVYTFAYGDRWQDLEAILGSQSYDGSPVPGNAVDIECIWEYCECNPNVPSCDLCMSNVFNYGTGTSPNYVPMIDISTAHYGGALGDGSLPYGFDDLEQVRDIITDPSNGLFNTDFREMKWEKMPWTGPGGTPMTYQANGCTPQMLNVAGYPDCDPYVADLGPSNGNFRTFNMGWAFGGGNFPPGQWFNWADLLNDVKVVVNAVPGIPPNMQVTSSDNWWELNAKADWYFVNVLGSSTNDAMATWSLPNIFVCGCSGQTQNPSYDPCHCVEIFGPGGYPTSAMCEEICCSGETSWSCNTGTTIAVGSSVNCGNRITEIPIQMTNSNYFSNQNPIGFIANPLNGFQTTLFSDLKYVSDGTIITSQLSQVDLCHDVNTVMTPDGVARWEHITQINAFSDSNNPVVSTLSWADFISQLQAPPHNLAVNLSMNAAQVFSVTQSLGWSLYPCTCPGDPCGCVEIPGTLGYPTSASCEVICCPDPSGRTSSTWDCTINGCVPSPMGTIGQFLTLANCEEVCKEWICDEHGDCIGSCDIGGNNTPRTELPVFVFGIPSDLLPYFASPATAPVQSPLLPPITNNMQQADITYYKFDCINCASTVQTCPSPHGTWWAPSGMWIENTPGSFPTTYSGPHYTWQDVVTAAQTQGFSVNMSTSYDDFKTALLADLRQVVIKGDPCYGQPSGCDCIPIDGTGHTGGWYWSSSNYQPCVDACCSGDTWDCTPTGCLPNNSNTGSYLSLSACTADCREWKCIPGTVQQDTCAGETYLNMDWSTILGADMRAKAANYFSHQLNMLQTTPVSNYKYSYLPNGVNTSPAFCEEEMFDAAGTSLGNYAVYKFRFFYVPNSALNAGINPVFTNATNYDPTTNTCPGIGCTFDTWADLIAGVQALGITYAGNSFPLTLNSAVSSVGEGISAYFNLNQMIYPLVANEPCLCSGSGCYCDELPGTGHTGNIYSDENLCDIAANATPCCTPPEDWWYCKPAAHPGPAGSGGNLQGECTCIQGVSAGTPGAYATLQECKDDTLNCCDMHYYDCLNQGTPQAGCVGLINGNWGPYQTAQLCDDDCPKIGYNCQIEDDGPGGSGNLACIPCVGALCQYTFATAAGSPYYGDAWQQCQDSCPGNDCWKCCMDINGYITQLSPALSPAQCHCPKETVEVQCDGSGPCPHPVSCITGYVYNWTYCRCVCEPNVSCAVGFHWSYVECKCVPNIVGPVDFVGSHGQVLQQIANFRMEAGTRHIINEFIEGIDLLKYMTSKGYYLGRDECTHCTDGTEGICVLDGCLYFPDYQKHRSLYVGWKSLLLTGNENLSIGTSCTAIDVNGYYPLYTTTSCAETHIGGNGTYHTHVLNGITYYMPNGLVMGVTQFHGDYVLTTTTPILTGATLNGYSCVDNPNNPPTYTECLEYGTAPYLAYFGNATPQYTTLQDCYAAGCDFSGTVYYQCTVETNTLVGENQQACVPVNGVGGPGLFTSLQDCLNSGCAGWMACDQAQVSEVNGVDIQANSLYPIPMCCESYINTATIPLTVTDCENHCSNVNETWFPLYNVIGINTFYESPLGYLLRELNPYVRNGTCAVSLTPDSIGIGNTQRTIYDINY